MKKKFSITYALVFLIATLSLSSFFNAAKNPTLSLSSLALFVASILYMAYRIYAEEKANSNLRVSFAPFEWIYSHCERSHSHCEQSEAIPAGGLL